MIWPPSHRAKDGLTPPRRRKIFVIFPEPIGNILRLVKCKARRWVISPAKPMREKIMSRTLNQFEERQYIGRFGGQCLRRLLVHRLRW